VSGLSHYLHSRRTATKAYAALLFYLSFCAADFCAAGEAIDASPQPGRYRVVGYLAGWASPSLIHPEKLTHINFAFARIGLDGHVALADTGIEANLPRLRALKRTNPGSGVLAEDRLSRFRRGSRLSISESCSLVRHRC